MRYRLRRGSAPQRLAIHKSSRVHQTCHLSHRRLFSPEHYQFASYHKSSCQRSRDRPEREGALEHKGGFIVGAQHGDGALIVNGRTVAYHNTVVVSYGFQAGVQKFGCAMFFITDASLNYLSKSGGWEVGTAPSLVVVDARMAKSLSSTTLNKGIYVFFFSQKGLMGGLGLQGTKITQYTSSAQTF